MDTKTCTICLEVKELEAFSRNCKGLLGRLTQCKECLSKANKLKYRTDPEFRAKAVWYALLQRIENTDGKNPGYAHVRLLITKEQFVSWYSRSLPDFFETYGHDATPSVDRIKNDEHYSPENIRLIPLGLNSALSPRNHNNFAPPGKAWCTHHKKYLPRAEFYNNQAQHHGVSHSCKECCRKRDKERREKRKNRLG